MSSFIPCNRVSLYQYCFIIAFTVILFSVSCIHFSRSVSFFFFPFIICFPFYLSLLLLNLFSSPSHYLVFPLLISSCLLSFLSPLFLPAPPFITSFISWGFLPSLLPPSLSLMNSLLPSIFLLFFRFRSFVSFFLSLINTALPSFFVLFLLFLPAYLDHD